MGSCGNKQTQLCKLIPLYNNTMDEKAPHGEKTRAETVF